MSPTFNGSSQHGTLNTAMWSKKVTESSSISTWDYHSCVFICWHNLTWNQYQCRCWYVCMYTCTCVVCWCGLKLCQCLLVHVDSYKAGFTTAKDVCPALAPLASVWGWIDCRVALVRWWGCLIIIFLMLQVCVYVLLECTVCVPSPHWTGFKHLWGDESAW